MRNAAVLVGLILALAACGDSGSDTTGTPAVPQTSVVTTTSVATSTSEAAESGVCPDDPFTGTIERTVQADTGAGVHVAARRTDDQLMSAYAYDFGTGDTYTIYVGDHEIDRDGVGTDTLTAPPGGMLATIFLISDEPLAAGSEIEFRFVPIVDTGGGAEISGFGASDLVGSATIIGITDQRICFDIDTTDPQQRLVGTVSAEFA